MSYHTHVIVFSWTRGPLGTGAREANAQWWQVHDWINGQALQLHQDYRVIRPLDNLMHDHPDHSILLAGVAEDDSEAVVAWVKHWLERLFGLQEVRAAEWGEERFFKMFPQYLI